MAKTIDEILSEADIKDVQVRYCRANDRLDEQLMRSCFHPGAIIELHKELNLEEFIVLGRQVLSAYMQTWHNTGNQLVEVRGDAAWAEHYTISSHRIAADEQGGERDWIAHCRNIDRMERRDGEWRIARRKIVVDYTRMDAVVHGDPAVPGGSGGGSRDRKDPSYAMRLA